MGRNVFVSYKYSDNNVRQFKNSNYYTTARDYVNVIIDILSETGDFYFRGEEDGEDLSDLNEGTIERLLHDKIFYTSITIVLITANMREIGNYEIDQWIPREIAYSLRNKTRTSGQSNMNAILAIAIPDINGSYRYILDVDKDNNRVIKDTRLFNIISQNMFNQIGRDYPTDGYGNMVYNKKDYEGSYIVMTKWDDFRCNPEYYLDLAIDNRGHWDEYQILKTIDPYWIS